MHRDTEPFKWDNEQNAMGKTWGSQAGGFGKTASDEEAGKGQSHPLGDTPLGFPCTLKGWNVPSKSQPPKKTSFQVVPHSTARLVSPDTVPRTSYPHFVFFSFKFSLTKICTSQSLPFLLKFRRKCSNGNSSVGRAVLWGL